jgi:hypothetical protein
MILAQIKVVLFDILLDVDHSPGLNVQIRGELTSCGSATRDRWDLHIA